MKIPNEFEGKYFFHFTHIENLDSIVKNGLLCTNEKIKQNLKHLNLASGSIQERRSTMSVTCGSKGNVHDYVPFYLCSVNPMFLSIINSKNIDQNFVVFLGLSIDKILDKDVVFTDASANTSIPPEFYNNPKDLNKLDWNAIENIRWGTKDKEELHRRMAEVLILNNVPINKIDVIIVWNKSTKEKVIKIFEKNKTNVPEISFSPYKRIYKLYFTKFMVVGKKGFSLITGPLTLKNKYEETISDINNARKSAVKGHKYLFENIEKFLDTIDKKFNCIKELDGIFQLETINDVHSENVSDHTLSVVKNVENSKYYNSLEASDKNILKLAAYLHDIGKGPKSKWASGKQPAYPDHPADAPEMLERILSEDIKNISEYEIKMICLLVTYHDLIGEIIGKGRSKEQLFAIIQNKKELDMLSCLNYADILAIDMFWKAGYNSSFPNLEKEVLEKISAK